MTSQANPPVMREYVSDIEGVRANAYDARTAFVDAYDAFAAALPEGFAAPERPDVAGPLGRSRDVDAHVSTVADSFEAAGSAAGLGLVTMDDALALSTLPYTASTARTAGRTSGTEPSVSWRIPQPSTVGPPSPTSG
jgi:hypothetical protein